MYVGGAARVGGANTFSRDVEVLPIDPAAAPGGPPPCLQATDFPEEQQGTAYGTLNSGRFTMHCMLYYISKQEEMAL